MNYHDVYWTVTFPNGTIDKVKSDLPDRYHIVTKKDCPFTTSSCCRFVTELCIHTVLAFNNTMINCTAEFIGSITPTSSTSNLGESL